MAEKQKEKGEVVLELKKTIEDLRGTVKEQAELLKFLTSPPFGIGLVQHVLETTAVIEWDGKVSETLIPKDKELTVGQQVRVCGKTGAIVDVIKLEATGSISIFRRMIDNRVCEVDTENGVTTVLVGKEVPQKGDRVIISDGVIRRNLGKQEERFTLGEKSRIGWEDIGGLEDAKQAIKEAVELPYQYPKIFKLYGKKPAKGILMYGPPGNGKTLLAKALATSIARQHGGEDGSLLYVKGPELLSKWVGESEATIRSLFERAKEFKKVHGYPAVLFIDEAESILLKRGSGISSDVNTTNVPAFLAEMDGMEESACIVVLATNRADRLDPAVIREGRIDRKIKIGRPGKKEAKGIADIHLRKRPIQGGPEKLSECFVEELFREERVLYKIKTKKGEMLDFGMVHLVSGAMIAGVVEQAISVALARDIQSGKPSGLTPEDLKTAVDRTFQDLSDVNHEDAIEEVIPRDQVASVTKKG